MRIFSAPSLQDLLRQEGMEVFVFCATLTHPLLPDPPGPIYVCTDVGGSIVVEGHTFLGWRFDIVFPSDKAKELPRSKVVIDNVNPMIGAAIQSIAGTQPMSCRLQQVRRSDPTAIDLDLSGFRIRHVKTNDLFIQGEMTYENLLYEPLTAKVTPHWYPGVFGGTTIS